MTVVSVQREGESQTYTYAAPPRRERIKGGKAPLLAEDANYSPYALIGRGVRMPAAGYTLDGVMRSVPKNSPLFFADEGGDIAAVEADRDTALSSNSGLMPRMATLYTTREGAHTGGGVVPTVRSRAVHRTLQTMSRTGAALLRGIIPQEATGESEVPDDTYSVAEANAAVQSAFLARDATHRQRTRAKESRVEINTKHAPLYMQEETERGTPLMVGRRRRTAKHAGLYANAHLTFYDPGGDIEREAISTFGHAGIFYMTESTALLYEGQPVLVFDSIQAMRHANYEQQVGARIHIFRGTQEEHEQVMQKHRTLRPTEVSISEYPV